ncbi:MAG TPA: hypothetical protein VGW96_02125, partial [Candidatus Eremiobacteraceae bacterium]|nr:hypothetical protein [Candidatus Eremiobacteraceae bacterium]
MSVIGTKRPRADGVVKVRGSATYVGDFALDGALVAVLLRSPHQFARIKRIDVARASRLPGVAAIAYSGTVPRKPLDFGIKDQHLFPIDYVRYAGEPVAAIAADTDEHARAAAAVIDIEYESLAPVTNIEQALLPNAPLVHPDWKNYERGANRVLRGNICGQNRIRRGDVDA